MRFIKYALLFGTLGGLSVVTSLYAVTTKTDSIVASVNNEKIYKSGIDIIVADLKKSGTSVDNKTRETLIQRLIEQKLVAQSAVKHGYDKRDDVKKQIQVMTEMVLQDRYFSDFLAQKITPQVIKAEFDKKMIDFKPNFEYKAAHILVDSPEKAQNIKQQLNHANNNTRVFADLAKKYSSDANAQSGGDLGYFSPEMMVQSFSDAVAKLSVGNISEPVKTDFGWHIIQLTDKRSIPKPTLEQLTPQIKAQLSRQFMQQHIAELKKKSDIKVFLPD